MRIMATGEVHSVNIIHYMYTHTKDFCYFVLLQHATNSQPHNFYIVCLIIVSIIMALDVACVVQERICFALAQLSTYVRVDNIVSRVGKYFNIIATSQYQSMQYQYHKHFTFNNITCAIYRRVLPNNTQHYYSVLIKFVPTNGQLLLKPMKLEVFIPELLQFLMAHMYNDVLLCLLQ